MIIFPPQTKFIGLIVIAGEGYVRWDSTYSRYTLRPVSPKPNNPEPHSHIYTYIYPWHLASVPVFCSYLPYTYTEKLLPDLFFYIHGTWNFSLTHLESDIKRLKWNFTLLILILLVLSVFLDRPPSCLINVIVFVNKEIYQECFINSLNLENKVNFKILGKPKLTIKVS